MKYFTIPEFSEYLAGEDGHIYSMKFHRLKPLKEGFDGQGKYLHVTLRKNNLSYVINVHRLVCWAYYGKKLELLDVSHLDGNRLNNKPENLVWESRSSNCCRKVRHGTDDCGVKNTRAKFNQDELNYIRQGLACGRTARNLAKQFNVNERLIGKIKRGEHYARS